LEEHFLNMRNTCSPKRKALSHASQMVIMATGQIKALGGCAAAIASWSILANRISAIPSFGEPYVSEQESRSSFPDDPHHPYLVAWKPVV
jgi:hypothetical protein